MDDSPFPIRGAIEGFYGTYYTFPERIDMLRFLGAHGFNFYLYGPKNDRQHRMRWWTPYPPAVLDAFGDCIRIGRDQGVTFCYSISFGVPLNYASPDDFRVVTDKFRDFYDRDCRAFGMLLDDTATGFAHEVNTRNFRNVAAAHADFANRIYDWLQALDEPCPLYMCPAEYFGATPFDQYLYDLGREMNPEVRLFYTGREICAPAITVADTQSFAEAARREPIIWDNYPANDLQMKPELHLGPLRHRDPELWRVCGGFAANLMNQAEASKIPLRTIAEYLRDPAGYDPDAAWERALTEAADAESRGPLRIFAENSLASCLSPVEAPHLDRLATAALADITDGRKGAESWAVRDLQGYLDVLDEAIYYLRNRMENLALRQDLVPWIDALDEKLWLTRGVLRMLGALEAGAALDPSLGRVAEMLSDVHRNSKRIGGNAVVSLAESIYERVRAAVGSQTDRSAADGPGHPESGPERFAAGGS